MAAVFNGSSSYLEEAAAGVTAAQLTLAGWFNFSNITADHCIVSVCDSGSATNYFHVVAAGSVAGDPIQAAARSNSANGFTATSTGYSANTWQHAAGVFSSTTGRASYLNAGSSGSNSTSVTPANLNRTGIGVRNGSSRTAFAAGMIAEVAIWNVALTTAELEALAAGHPPHKVRLAGLVRYWPLVNNTICMISGTSLTNTGVTFTTHPRRIG